MVYQRHIAFQNINELRKFIQTRLTHKAADLRDLVFYFAQSFFEGFFQAGGIFAGAVSVQFGCFLFYLSYRLSGAASFKHLQHRLEQYLHIQHKGPVVRVPAKLRQDRGPPCFR